MEQVIVKDLVFTLHRSERRKTVGIVVERDGDLILRAPIDCSLSEIQRVALERLLWVQTKLAEKHLLFQPTRPKSYIDGESFYYLGQCYRLRLTDGSAQTGPLVLQGEWFWLRRDAQPQAENHFRRWYTEQALQWLPARVQQFASRVSVKPSAINVRTLGFRWGSCSSSGQLNFHWQVMLLSPEIIDYIVVHELVHLKLRRHNTVFWQLVERIIPNYQNHKNWLIERGGSLADLSKCQNIRKK